jgi:hypothetical protein
MADIDTDTISQLMKKIDDQHRFTRIVTVLAISSLVYALPDLVVAKVMSNMESLHTEWKQIEKVGDKTAPVEKK